MCLLFCSVVVPFVFVSFVIPVRFPHFLQGKKSQFLPEIRQKVYDPATDKSYTKAKAAKWRRNAGNSGFIDANLSSSFVNFPREDSAFKEDFSVLPVFVPNDTLDHLKECGKETKKSTPGDREGGCHRLNMTHVQLRAEGLTLRQRCYFRSKSVRSYW